MDFSTYSSLLSTVADVWYGHCSINTLTSTLTAYKSVLTDPCEQLPSAASRQQVQSKRVTVDGVILDLSDGGASNGQQTVDFILSLSAKVALNEIDTVRLVCSVTRGINAQSPSRDPSQSLSDAVIAEAETRYFTRRRNLLRAIVDVITLTHPRAQVDAETKRFMLQYVAHIIRDGLLINVLTLIEQISKHITHAHSQSTTQTPTSTALMTQRRCEELYGALHVVLTITQSDAFDIQTHECVKLIQTLQSHSSQLTTLTQPALPSTSTTFSSQSSASSTVVRVLSHLTYTLLTSLIASLHGKVSHLQALVNMSNGYQQTLFESTVTASAVSGAFVSDASEIDSFISKVNEVGSVDEDRNGGWNHTLVQSTYMLAWALTLRQTRTIMPQLQRGSLEDDRIIENMILLALSPDIRLFNVILTDWIASANVRCDDAKDMIGETWFRFISSCLIVHSMEFDLLRREERRIEQSIKRSAAASKSSAASTSSSSSAATGGSGLSYTNYSSAIQCIAECLQHNPECIHEFWLRTGLSDIVLRDITADSTATNPSTLISNTNNTTNMNETSYYGNSSGMSYYGNSNITSSSGGGSGGGSHTSLVISETALVYAEIAVLIVLCHGDENLQRVHYILTHSLRLSYEAIFDYIKQWARVFAVQQQQQQQQQPNNNNNNINNISNNTITNVMQSSQLTSSTAIPSMMSGLLMSNFSHSSMLIALLRLLSAVCRSPTVRSIIYRSNEYRCVDRLFVLLSIHSPAYVKAAIIDCLSSVVRYDQEACLYVWERLDASYALNGLTYDICELEVNTHTYPLTVAVTKLIVTLFEATSTVSDAATRHVGWIELIIRHVWLPLYDRIYDDVLQRWQLSEYCLALLCLLIRQSFHQQSSAASPGAQYVNEILNAKEMFSKLCEVLSRAYAAIETDPFLPAMAPTSTQTSTSASSAATTSSLSLTSPSSATSSFSPSSSSSIKSEYHNAHVEGTAVLALYLFQSIMSRSTAFVQLILHHPQTVLVISRCIAYEHQFALTDVTRLALADDADTRLKPHRLSSSAQGHSASNINVNVGTDMETRLTSSDTVSSEIDDNDNNGETDGLIAYYSARILLHLITLDDSLVCHILRANEQRDDIIQSFITQISRAHTVASSASFYAENDSRRLDETTSALIQSGGGAQTADEADSDSINRACLTLLHVLLQSLSRSTIHQLSLAHIVFGVDQQRDDVERPAFIDTAMELISKSKFCISVPAIAESLLHLIYQLCARANTSQSVLQYIRSRYQQLFVRLLRSLPLPAALTSVSPSAFIYLPLQRQWLYRCISLDLYNAVHQPTSDYDDYVANTLTLIGISSGHGAAATESHQWENEDDNAERNGAIIWLNPNAMMTPINIPSQTLPITFDQCKLFDIVSGTFVYDVSRVYQQIISTNNTQSNALSVARQTCAMAVEWNTVSQRLSVMVRCIRSFCELITLAIAIAITDTANQMSKNNANGINGDNNNNNNSNNNFDSNNINNTNNNNNNNSMNNGQLSVYNSMHLESTLIDLFLLILSYLQSTDISLVSASAHLSRCALNCSVALVDLNIIYSDRLLLIHEQLLAALIIHTAASTRINLYAIYCHMMQLPAMIQALNAQCNQQRNHNNNNNNNNNNTGIIGDDRISERLLTLVNADAINGAIDLRLNANSFIQCLMSTDTEMRANQELLTDLISHITQRDHILKKSLESSSHNNIQRSGLTTTNDHLKIYESTMASLITIAISPRRLDAMMDCQVIEKLGGMSVWSVRPYTDSDDANYNLLIYERLVALHAPFYTLITALLSHTAEHRRAQLVRVTQLVCDWLQSHDEVVMHILRDTHPQQTDSEALSLVRSLLNVIDRIFDVTYHVMLDDQQAQQHDQLHDQTGNLRSTYSSPLKNESDARGGGGLSGRISGLLKFVGASPQTQVKPQMPPTPSHQPHSAHSIRMETRVRCQKALQRYYSPLLLLLQRFAQKVQRKQDSMEVDTAQSSSVSVIDAIISHILNALVTYSDGLSATVSMFGPRMTTQYDTASAHSGQCDLHVILDIIHRYTHVSQQSSSDIPSLILANALILLYGAVRIYVTPTIAPHVHIQRSQSITQFKADAIKYILPTVNAALNAINGVDTTNTSGADMTISSAITPASTISPAAQDTNSFTVNNASFLTLIITKTQRLIQ